MTLIYASRSKGKVKLVSWNSSRSVQEAGVLRTAIFIFKTQTSHTKGLVLVPGSH